MISRHHVWCYQHLYESKWCAEGPIHMLRDIHCSHSPRLPQVPHYEFQLSATPRKILQKCLNFKTLAFAMATRIYPVQTKRAKSFLQRLDFSYSSAAVFTGFNRMVCTHFLAYTFLTVLLLTFTAFKYQKIYHGNSQRWYHYHVSHFVHCWCPYVQWEGLCVIMSPPNFISLLNRYNQKTFRNDHFGTKVALPCSNFHWLRSGHAWA